jgi:hypothetical protein
MNYTPDGYIRFEKQFTKFYRAQVLCGKTRRILNAKCHTATAALWYGRQVCARYERMFGKVEVAA